MGCNILTEMQRSIILGGKLIRSIFFLVKFSLHKEHWKSWEQNKLTNKKLRGVTLNTCSYWVVFACLHYSVGAGLKRGSFEEWVIDGFVEWGLGRGKPRGALPAAVTLPTPLVFPERWSEKTRWAWAALACPNLYILVQRQDGGAAGWGWAVRRAGGWLHSMGTGSRMGMQWPNWWCDGSPGRRLRSARARAQLCRSAGWWSTGRCTTSATSTGGTRVVPFLSAATPGRMSRWEVAGWGRDAHQQLVLCAGCLASIMSKSTGNDCAGNSWGLGGCNGLSGTVGMCKLSCLCYGNW